MYDALIKSKFPQDEQVDLYRVPNLPGMKLGKVLRKDKRINSPSDVLAMHLHDSVFSSSVILFTKDTCFYSGGKFLLEDVKDAQQQKSTCIVIANQQGAISEHKLSTKNEQVARTLERLFKDIRFYDPEAGPSERDYEAEGFSGTELDWLNLRDEVMLTIDMLYERYNDGKLSLLEYEEKKQKLLDRL